jgi:hypothetical protein
MALASEILAPPASPVGTPVHRHGKDVFQRTRCWIECVKVIILTLPAFSLAAALAGPMLNDPQGFQNIPWGTKLAEVPNLVLADPGERVTGYDFKNGPPAFGEAKVDSVRLSAIEGKFARAAIHYKGRKTHEHIMNYLESSFGPIDRAPGSMMRGLNQQYNWRGSETEINLVYQSYGERGVVFIESRVLAPRFNDTLSETAY